MAIPGKPASVLAHAQTSWLLAAGFVSCQNRQDIFDTVMLPNLLVWSEIYAFVLASTITLC